MTVHLLRPPPPEPEPPRPLLYWWLYAHPAMFSAAMIEAACKAWARPTERKK